MVNTFLPHALPLRHSDMAALLAALRRNAAALDRRRLGKQRVEAHQIHAVLRAEADGIKGRLGWSAHPATRMWRGHGALLRLYTRAMCQEWARRGYSNAKMAEHLASTDAALDLPDEALAARPLPPLPAWVSDEAFCAAHRAALYWKAPADYAAFQADYEAAEKEPSGRPRYIWPVAAK